MTEVTIRFPASSISVPLGDTGKVTTVDIAAIAKAHPQVIALAAVNGFMGALNNISRGKDDDGKANSDAVWESARAKRMDAWLQGDWASKGGGGDRNTASLRDAFTAERMALGATSAQVDKLIKAQVAEAFGDKEPATFNRFMDALALTLAKRDHGPKATDAQVVEKRDAIEAKYRRLAEEAAAQRAKTKAALDLTSIDI